MFEPGARASVTVPGQPPVECARRQGEEVRPSPQGQLTRIAPQRGGQPRARSRGAERAQQLDSRGARRGTPLLDQRQLEIPAAHQVAHGVRGPRREVLVVARRRLGIVEPVAVNPHQLLEPAGARDQRFPRGGIAHGVEAVGEQLGELAPALLPPHQTIEPIPGNRLPVGRSGEGATPAPLGLAGGLRSVDGFPQRGGDDPGVGRGRRVPRPFATGRQRGGVGAGVGGPGKCRRRGRWPGRGGGLGPQGSRSTFPGNPSFRGTGADRGPARRLQELGHLTERPREPGPISGAGPDRDDEGQLVHPRSPELPVTIEVRQGSRQGQRRGRRGGRRRPGPSIGRQAGTEPRHGHLELGLGRRGTTSHHRPAVGQGARLVQEHRQPVGATNLPVRPGVRCPVQRRELRRDERAKRVAAPRRAHRGLGDRGIVRPGPVRGVQEKMVRMAPVQAARVAKHGRRQRIVGRGQAPREIGHGDRPHQQLLGGAGLPGQLLEQGPHVRRAGKGQRPHQQGPSCAGTIAHTAAVRPAGELRRGISRRVAPGRMILGPGLGVGHPGRSRGPATAGPHRDDRQRSALGPGQPPPQHPFERLRPHPPVGERTCGPEQRQQEPSVPWGLAQPGSVAVGRLVGASQALLEQLTLFEPLRCPQLRGGGLGHGADLDLAVRAGRVGWAGRDRRVERRQPVLPFRGARETSAQSPERHPGVRREEEGLAPVLDAGGIAAERIAQERPGRVQHPPTWVGAGGDLGGQEREVIRVRDPGGLAQGGRGGRGGRAVTRSSGSVLRARPLGARARWGVGHPPGLHHHGDGQILVGFSRRPWHASAPSRRLARRLCVAPGLGSMNRSVPRGAAMGGAAICERGTTSGRERNEDEVATRRRRGRVMGGRALS